MWHTDPPLRVKVVTEEPCGDLCARFFVMHLSIED